MIFPPNLVWKAAVYPLVNRFLRGEELPIPDEKIKEFQKVLDDVTSVTDEIDVDDPFSYPRGINKAISKYLNKKKVNKSFNEVMREFGYELVGHPSDTESLLAKLYSNIITYDMPRTDLNLDGKDEEAFVLPTGMALYTHSRESYLLYTDSGKLSGENTKLLSKYFWCSGEYKHLGRNNSDISLTEMNIEDASYYGDLNQKRNKIRQFFNYDEKWTLLLQGKPGIGKTTFCYDIASQLSDQVLILSGDYLQRMTQHTWRYIQQTVQPEILICNDIDRLPSVDTILPYLEDRNVEADLILMTTNYVDNLPPAVRRPGRVDHILRIQPPSKGTRNTIIKNLANEMGVEIPKFGDCFEKLDHTLEKGSPAHVREVLKRAKVWGWEEEETWNIHDIAWEKEDGGSIPQIDREDFEEW